MCAKRANWMDSMPACLAGSGCDEALSLGECVFMARIELDLIEEGQEAAECYTRAEVKQIRRFIKDNRASLAVFGGAEPGTTIQ